MKSNMSKISIIVGLIISVPGHTLTLNGTPRSSTLEVCFDDSAISQYVVNATEREERKQWARDAMELESWEYYTNLDFTGWGDCASTSNPDIRISQDNNGTRSSGDTVYIPFRNTSNPNFERYHIQSAIIHEIGHQLKFPHEHLRMDSTYYSGDTINQKFRIEPTEGDWFNIVAQVNDLCLTVSTSSSQKEVTQELCSETTRQEYRMTGGTFGDWVSIESRHHSNRCLDIDWAGMDWGDHLVHWQCSSDPNTNSNQKFRLIDYPYTNASFPIYSIEAQHSNLWIDIPGGSESPGVKPIQYRPYSASYIHLTPNYDSTSVMSYENNSSRPNSFILLNGDISGSQAAYGNSGNPKISEYLVSKLSNLCFSYDGTTATQQSCSSSDSNQKLRLIYLDNNEFRIFDEQTQMCISESNDNLILDTCNGESGSQNTNQRFSLLEGESASWSRIQSKSSGKCLDIEQEGTTSGTPIILYNCWSNLRDNQLFSVRRDISDLE